MSSLDPDTIARMNVIWGTPPGFVGWLSAVNHRAVGKRFLVTSLVFFLIGGIEALVMRLQLARPMNDLVDPGTFNQLFTMHGSTMMFLFAVPLIEGLFIYLVPLMIGTRDMAFPRLNAFGYWVYLIAGLVLHVGLLTGVAPHSGWFSYVPLAGPGYSPGLNIDLWVTMITFIEVSALSAAVELVVTILRQRAPGMSLNRMPVFVWSALVTAFMIIFAMPPLIVTSLLLALDRFAGTQFFNVAGGGEPLLWQHLFWFFGHPDVYIMLVPALGIVSTLLPLWVRRPLAGYTLVTLSTIAIGFISFGLWVHHMYAAGLPLMGASFFGAASMMITVPNAIIIFAWIVTAWRSRPVFSASFLFVVGFVVLLILGGITGIMVASVPFDWQVHDTYFVVAHFHYVLIGGVVFPIFAALYAWFPKVFGVVLGERLGRWHFWLFFVGFNVTFFPMHLLGLQGMPRRIYTYLHGLGWEPMNLIATAGAMLMGVATALLVANVAVSLARRKLVGPNPWGAATLEWLPASPPPQYNFEHIPLVADTEPLWNGRGEPERWPRGALIDREGELGRDTLVTTPLDAEPEARVRLPGPSLWPLYLALASTVAFLGAIVDLLFVLVGFGLAAICLFGWLWPTSEGATSRAPKAAAHEGDALGTDAVARRFDSGADNGAEHVLDLRHLRGVLPGRRTSIWMGMALFIVIEATVVVSLVTSYYYFRVMSDEGWPPPGVPQPALLRPGLSFLLLVGSLVLVLWTRRRPDEGATRPRRPSETGVMVGACVLLGVYLVASLLDLVGSPFLWSEHVYGSLVWTLGGYQLMHGAVLLLLSLGVIALRLRRQRVLRRMGIPVAGASGGEAGGDGAGYGVADTPQEREEAALAVLRTYWTFVVVVSVPTYFTLYLTPHLP